MEDFKCPNNECPNKSDGLWKVRVDSYEFHIKCAKCGYTYTPTVKDISEEFDNQYQKNTAAIDRIGNALEQLKASKPEYKAGSILGRSYQVAITDMEKIYYYCLHCLEIEHEENN